MTNELNLETKSKAPRRRKIVSLDKRKSRVGWLFVLPFLIGFVFIYLPIVKDSFMLAFSDISRSLDGSGGYELTTPEDGIFGNFQYALFTDPGFVQTLIKGIGQLLFEVPAILLFSLFMAVLLNQKMMGRAAFRAIFFLPVVLATGIMETIEAGNVFGSYMGEGGDIGGAASGGAGNAGGGSSSQGIVSAMDIESLFSNMKVGQEFVKYVVDIINNIYAIVNRSGVQMLIFLAGLQSISPAIYEACKIDGATGWETFWKITFPMISPMILVNAVYTIIDSFTVESNSVMSYISSIGNSQSQGKATAMAWLYFLIVVLILAAVAGIMSAFVFYQRKE